MSDTLQSWIDTLTFCSSEQMTVQLASLIGWLQDVDHDIAFRQLLDTYRHLELAEDCSHGSDLEESREMARSEALDVLRGAAKLEHRLRSDPRERRTR